MKTVLVVLFFLGLVLLHCQADHARRSLLEEKIKTEKTGNHEVASDDEPSKSGVTDEKQVAASGSGPRVDANGESKSSSNEEEKNNSYGTYGNPSGSSTDTHHYYISDRPPAKEH